MTDSPQPAPELAAVASDAQLSAAVAAAPGGLVRPHRPRAAAVDIPEPLRLLDSLDLGQGRHLAVVQDAAGTRWTVPLVLSGSGTVRRAVAGDGLAEALVRNFTSGRSSRFGVTGWYAEDVDGERAVTVDQTNESVVVGERAVVKWCLRLPAAGLHGTQPAGERMAALATAGFTGTPRPWFLLRWDDGAGEVLLATVAEYLPGARDGWDWAVDDVRAFARGVVGLSAAVAPARDLGTLVAGMHAAFAAAGASPAGADDVGRWAARARAHLDEALRLVDGPEGRRLRSRARQLSTAIEVLAGCVGTPLVPVHGDLHVGQVLRYGDPYRYAVTDFDGNPVLPEAERGAPQPVALDVAGMLASLDHVGRVVVRRTDGVDAGLVEGWIGAAQDAFLGTYRAALEEAGLAGLLDERLLVPLRLAQEVREYLYAVHHLPHWRYVPDAALRSLLPED